MLRRSLLKMLSSLSAIRRDCRLLSSQTPNPSTHVGPADSPTSCIHFAGGWALGQNKLPNANGGRPRGAEAEVERLRFWQKDGSLSGPSPSSQPLIIHCHPQRHLCPENHRPLRLPSCAQDNGGSNRWDRCNFRANSCDLVCPKPAQR